VAILLVAAGVRFYLLGDQSLWYDESDRVFIASLAPEEIFPAMAEEGLHYLPLYFFIQKPFVHPFSEMMVRFPSAWFGILAVALAAQVGRVIWGNRAGLISALLLSLNTFHVWYSRDASFYAVVSVSSLGSLYCFLRLLRERRPSLWLGLGAFTSLGICTHYFAFAMPVVQLCYIVLGLRRNHRLLRGWALSQALAFLPLVPWYAFVIRRGVFYYGTAGVAAPVPLDIMYTLWNYSIGYAGGLDLLIALSLVAFWSAFLLGIGLAARRERSVGRLLTLWLALPVVLAFGMAFRVPMYVDRYLMPAFPAFLLLVAGGVTTVGRRARGVLLAALVVASAAATLRLYHDPAYAKEDWRGVARHIEANEKPGDLIMPLRYQSLTPLVGQYYRGRLPLRPVLVQGQERDPEQISAGYRRVWLIVPHAHALPDEPSTIHLLARCQPTDALDSASYSERMLGVWIDTHRAHLVWQSEFTCISLLLFELPGTDQAAGSASGMVLAGAVGVTA
jgi:4-amino-4-deoxy-L-arabinose transferase-like glycosyltransferase